MTLENLEKGIEIKDRITKLIRQKQIATEQYSEWRLSAGPAKYTVLDNKESVKRIMAHILYEIESEIQALEKEFESL